jgi:(1->4)-alpha-D-glucan 1-alpha-D-glucosylmutase
VNYEVRRRLLGEMRHATDDSLAAMLFESRSDGRLKLFTMMRALETRAACREIFESGEYLPLRTSGVYREHVFAFARVHEQSVAITCVPRLVSALVKEADAPALGNVWQDTAIELPDSWKPAQLIDAFTRRSIDLDGAGRVIPAASLFGVLPIALLTTR